MRIYEITNRNATWDGAQLGKSKFNKLIGDYDIAIRASNQVLQLKRKSQFPIALNNVVSCKQLATDLLGSLSRYPDQTDPDIISRKQKISQMLATLSNYESQLS